ncbi:MAG: hypothetical protein H0V89_00150 [Deltaproteobacteria bacterium]|nr:hypothetical protein [Deltaproteobacteria bacterium]
MIEVALASGLPAATAAWDEAHALGRALLETGRYDTIQVRVNNNTRSAVRYRCAARVLNLSVHWRVLGQTADLVELVARGSRPAWLSIQERLGPDPTPREVDLEPRGDIHDLAALAEAEQIWLPQPVQAVIGWGRWPHRAPERGLRFGSCTGQTPPVIRIHPVLDHGTVPGWYVGFVVFHELLHVAIPPTPGAGRRVVHSRTFGRHEATHPEFHRAHAWEIHEMPFLLARIAARVSGGGPGPRRGSA